SHRYPKYVQEVAQRVGVHVINRDLETQFPGSCYIPDGIFDEHFGRTFIVVGMSGTGSAVPACIWGDSPGATPGIVSRRVKPMGGASCEQLTELSLWSHHRRAFPAPDRPRARKNVSRARVPRSRRSPKASRPDLGSPTSPTG